MKVTPNFFNFALKALPSTKNCIQCMNVQRLCALGRIFKLHVVQCRRPSNLQNKAT